MGNKTVSRQDAILEKQTALLYKGVRFSCATSITTAFGVVYAIGSWSSQISAWLWFSIISITYIARWHDSHHYYAADNTKTHIKHWNKRYKLGAYTASAAWASGIWFLYPSNQPAYQAVLVLIMSGVVGAALATQPYDKKVIAVFQGFIFVGVESRLLWEGDLFSLELASLCLLLFSFVLGGGWEIAKNYYDLLSLRQDSEDTNLEIIKTTEEMAQIGYWKWDMTSPSIEVSNNLASIWNLSGVNIELEKYFNLIHKNDLNRVKRVVYQSPNTENESAVEYRVWLPKKNRYLTMNQVTKRISDSQGIEYLLSTVQDISAIKSAEEKIYHMAYYDELTSLANRGHFHEHLKAHVEFPNLTTKKLAILYIDLDDFKEINDSYGHECGDIYLSQFANHLKRQLRSSDFIARVGGDEFCIVLHDIRDDDEISQATERCLSFMHTVVRIRNHKICPKMSIGISRYPEHGQDPDTLVGAADLAMYSVKRNGKHGFEFYNEKMASDSSDQIKLEADLRHAIKNNEFELFYQPKIFLQDDKLTAVEALIRWRHPTRGMVNPDLFINTAERIGMIEDIGRWVLRAACRQLQLWKQEGLPLQVAINISSSHFVSHGFVDSVIDSLQEFEIESDELEIEITESVSRNNEEHTLICHKLRRAGVRIAIDDFGTGYSSLSVLGQMEVDTLKIDRSFIVGLPNEPNSVLMVKTIVELSLGLGYNIVAEGVENLDQYDLLKSLGCPYIQGYFFSKPVSPEEIPKLAAKNWLHCRSYGIKKRH